MIDKKVDELQKRNFKELRRGGVVIRLGQSFELFGSNKLEMNIWEYLTL